MELKVNNPYDNQQLSLLLSRCKRVSKLIQLNAPWSIAKKDLERIQSMIPSVLKEVDSHIEKMRTYSDKPSKVGIFKNLLWICASKDCKNTLSHVDDSFTGSVFCDECNSSSIKKQ